MQKLSSALEKLMQNTKALIQRLLYSQLESWRTDKQSAEIRLLRICPQDFQMPHWSFHTPHRESQQLKCRTSLLMLVQALQDRLSCDVSDMVQVV